MEYLQYIDNLIGSGYKTFTTRFSSNLDAIAAKLKTVVPDILSNNSCCNDDELAKLIHKQFTSDLGSVRSESNITTFELIDEKEINSATYDTPGAAVVSENISHSEETNDNAKINIEEAVMIPSSSYVNDGDFKQKIIRNEEAMQNRSNNYQEGPGYSYCSNFITKKNHAFWDKEMTPLDGNKIWSSDDRFPQKKFQQCSSEEGTNAVDSSDDFSCFQKREISVPGSLSMNATSSFCDNMNVDVEDVEATCSNNSWMLGEQKRCENNSITAGTSKLLLPIKRDSCCGKDVDNFSQVKKKIRFADEVVAGITEQKGGDEVTLNNNVSSCGEEESLDHIVGVSDPTPPTVFLTHATDAQQNMDVLNQRIVDGLGKQLLCPDVYISRDLRAINEFCDNDKIFLECQFSNDLYHRGLPVQSSVNQVHRNFLFTYYDGRFSKDKTFVFFAMNQMIRHQHVRQVNMMVNHNPAYVQRFETIVNQPEFGNRLAQCIKNPASTETKKLLLELKPLVNIANTKSLIGPHQVSQTRNYLTNLIRFLGLPMFFLTIAPLDIDNVLTVRLSLMSCRSGSSYHIGQSFSNTIYNECIELAPTLDYGKRQHYVLGNVVASSIVFSSFLEHLFENLLQYPLHSKFRKTMPLDERHQGILGKLTGAFAAIDSQVML